VAARFHELATLEAIAFGPGPHLLRVGRLRPSLVFYVYSVSQALVERLMGVADQIVLAITHEVLRGSASVLVGPRPCLNHVLIERSLFGTVSEALTSAVDAICVAEKILFAPVASANAPRCCS